MDMLQVHTHNHALVAGQEGVPDDAWLTSVHLSTWNHGMYFKPRQSKHSDELLAPVMPEVATACQDQVCTVEAYETTSNPTTRIKLPRLMIDELHAACRSPT